MTAVANPAYITVLDKLAAVWILVVYALIGRKEQSDVFSDMMLVLCACLLIVVASQI